MNNNQENTDQDGDSYSDGHLTPRRDQGTGVYPRKYVEHLLGFRFEKSIKDILEKSRKTEGMNQDTFSAFIEAAGVAIETSLLTVNTCLSFEDPHLDGNDLNDEEYCLSFTKSDSPFRIEIFNRYFYQCFHCYKMLYEEFGTKVADADCWKEIRDVLFKGIKVCEQMYDISKGDPEVLAPRYELGVTTLRKCLFTGEWEYPADLHPSDADMAVIAEDCDPSYRLHLRLCQEENRRRFLQGLERRRSEDAEDT